MVLAMPSGKFESVSNGFAYALGGNLPAFAISIDLTVTRAKLQMTAKTDKACNCKISVKLVWERKRRALQKPLRLN